MSILTKEVEVKLTANTVEYYKNLGYEIPMKKASKEYARKKKKQYVYDFSKSIVVKTKDLQDGSHAIVEVLCDCCNEEILKMTYNSYNQRMKQNETITCKKCGYIRRVDTYIQRYGVDNYAKTKECHEKMELTMEKLYGIKHALQSEEFRNSYEETCIEKYGRSYRKQFTKKAFETFYNKTGYNHPFQSPEVRAKIIQSCIDHYGADNPVKAQEVRIKMNETLCKNGNQKTSKQQLYLHNLYGGELNYPISYYATDICFPEEKFVIEYDGGGHDLRVTLGQLTQEEFDHKELVRDKVIKSEGYKIIRIQSKTDKLPSDSTLLQMLSYARNYFSQYPQHSWIEFSIDSSSIRSAEYKDGIFFDYGELRTIKEVA